MNGFLISFNLIISHWMLTVPFIQDMDHEDQHQAQQHRHRAQGAATAQPAQPVHQGIAQIGQGRRQQEGRKDGGEQVDEIKEAGRSAATLGSTWAWKAALSW